MGEITYRHLYGNTYEFTVKTCTKLTAEADRPELEINYGDGDSDTIPRISQIQDPITDTKENLYRGIHTFSGPGTFTIQVEDPNRNMGIINISNSVEKIFCIQSVLVISPFLSPNNSVQFSNCPCPEIACMNQPWVYNLAAFDTDEDSLSYSLIPCKGENCADFAIPQVYQYPQTVGGGTMSVHPVTGTIVWDSPAIIGEYNLAILVTEWRNGVRIGSVIVDMQLTVAPCNNVAPEITDIADTCVQAGTHLTRSVTATDSDLGQTLQMTAEGVPFQLENSPALFSSVPAQSSVIGTFSWTPDCAAIRNSPYNVLFEVSDNAQDVSLRDMKVWNITVNAPPVTGLVVTPSGTSMELNWDDYFCDEVHHYSIYRNTDSVVIDDDCCSPGSLSGSGFEQIGTSETNSYTDTDELIIGNRYCYIITAVFENGIESCASETNCSQLDFSVPILTHVTITSTDVSSGSDSIRWTHPRDLNPLQFPGPYSYNLYRSIAENYPEELIFQTTTEAVLEDCDTLFTETTLNTTANGYRYRIELVSNGAIVGSGASSSSSFLSIIPNDNQLELSWTTNTSWQIDSTDVYRESSPGSGVFTMIERVYGTEFIDAGLINQQLYCYKVKTYGSYSLPSVIRPLVNWSQEVCAAPYDYTAPCSPSLTLLSDCDASTNFLSWNNPNQSCSDDVTRYAVYFSPDSLQEPSLLEIIEGDQHTDYAHFLPQGTPGCYYVTALDSIPYNNESLPSNKTCVEHCEPLYTLPNVITNNGDGINDIFHPQLPYKFIDHVEFRLFNRWGQILFETQDPLINWDGTESKKGKKVTEGVYFYTCRVYFLTLSGEQFMDLHGFVHVFNGN